MLVTMLAVVAVVCVASSCSSEYGPGRGRDLADASPDSPDGGGGD